MTDRLRVLVVDDAHSYRELLGYMFEESGGFEVVAEAADGGEAVRAAREAEPDVVTLDLAMPLMDGLQALPEIRRHCPGTKIVVLSGFGDEQLRDQALSLGADAFVGKQEDFSHLASTIADLFGGT